MLFMMGYLNIIRMKVKENVIIILVYVSRKHNCRFKRNSVVKD